jgi:hypothetical protein
MFSVGDPSGTDFVEDLSMQVERNIKITLNEKT